MSNLETNQGRLAAIETFAERCPDCGSLLYRPKGLSKVTGKKMAGVCMNCGYKQPPTEPKNVTPDMEKEARKNRTVGYYLAYSVFSTDAIIAKDFNNFHTDGSLGQQQLKLFAVGLSNKICRNEVVHALIIGDTGVGKSHIANGILIDTQTKTGYRKTCLFIDWNALMQRLKSGMGANAQDVRMKNEKIMHEIGKADVVVIDDLGSERGSDFDRQTADDVFRMREDKATIVTTNLHGKDLNKRYGERTMSRMAKHGQGNSFGVKGILDQRKEALP
ncbi:helicase loader [Lacticaseibacillus casei 12A]|uniref:ATP-binding protein n=1 Tax=Lacticaseibacillus paracasei TaxID=1597 RepID=UPI000297DF0B|nr:ATP-binding protein [Lacticaseibacillus paracasei]EKP99638.1 helicase loader [Lacticaseibacillus casei 12A]